MYFELQFWKRPYNPENTFLPDNTAVQIVVQINDSSEGENEIYSVVLKDIGLRSQFGDFNIVRSAGRWVTSQQDGPELTQLKWDISAAIDSYKQRETL